jgi:4-nitrophenyl phosphatase
VDFSGIKAVVSDMDGVLWRGDMPLPGLVPFFEALRARGLPFVLATNNSSKTQADYVRKLAGMGVTGVAEAAIVTSGTATAAYLKMHYPAGTRVHVFGAEGLCAVIAAAGFTLADSDVRVVVAGLKWNLTYDDLKTASRLVRAGADFIGTNPDATFPLPDGLAPGAGSMIAALQTAAGREPLIIGKPHPPMFEAALAALGTAPADTLMIGDRLNTDIVGAAACGLRTALVLTGITTAADINGSVRPDAVFDGLPPLVDALAAV